MSKRIKILAIESSCDETAAAVIGVEKTAIGDRPVILSNVINSQIDLHAKTGGVVPEVASRAHLEVIVPVVALALLKQQEINDHLSFSSSQLNELKDNQVNGKWKMDNDKYQEAIKLLDDITHIAVTAGPGLIGSLLVGFNAAKALAYAKDIPIIPVNHIEGHIYSAFATTPTPLLEKEGQNRNPLLSEEGQGVVNSEVMKPVNNKSIFPIIALTVSGGHTSLTLMKNHGKYEILGETLDDAVGEAYDKVAKLLGLGYPGGPVISKLANRFRNNFQLPITNNQSIRNSRLENNQINGKIAKCKNSKICPLGISFPRPIINDGTFNFSLSGLKTAVLQKVIELKKGVISSEAEKSLGNQKISPPTLSSRDDNKIDLGAINLPENVKEEIAFAFEEAVADVLSTKTLKAINQYNPKAVIFAGGVSANAYLQERLRQAVERVGLKFFLPSKGLYGDNAAMIGVAAFYHIKSGHMKSWDEIEIDSNLELV